LQAVSVKAGILAMVAVGFCGCAAMEVNRQEARMDSLRRAGFVSVPVQQLSDDPRFASLAPHTLQEVEVRSGIVTCYYDPGNRRVLVGGAREAAAYAAMTNGSRMAVRAAQRGVIKDRPMPVR
jgi:hypothetical protein